MSDMTLLNLRWIKQASWYILEVISSTCTIRISFKNTKMTSMCVKSYNRMLVILVHFVHFYTTSVDCTDLHAHEEEYVLDNCSQQSEKLLLGNKQIFVRLFCFCVQPDFLYTACYMLCCQDWYFFLLQRKINCKEGWEFVFILAW